MKIATLRTHAGTRVARLEGDDIVVLDRWPDVGTLLAEDPDWRAHVEEAEGRHFPVNEADFAPVVPDPPKIMCLGLNYRNHILEMGRELPIHPTLFAKFSRALIGARDPIILPRVANEVDWEVELAIVIDRAVRYISPDQARDAIAGYTVLNDVSMRDWQRRTIEWLQGKSFERSTPVGPWLATPDEVDDARDLQVRCLVDGEVMQEARTSDLLFKPADIVSYISQFVTLEPGDLISTGTPGGVGAARKPRVFLKAGQVVTTTIECIGELINACVDEDAHLQAF